MQVDLWDIRYAEEAEYRTNDMKSHTYLSLGTQSFDKGIWSQSSYLETWLLDTWTWE